MFIALLMQHTVTERSKTPKHVEVETYNVTTIFLFNPKSLISQIVKILNFLIKPLEIISFWLQNKG